MFKQQNRSTIQGDNENNTQQLSTSNIEKVQETESKFVKEIYFNVFVFSYFFRQ